MWLWTWLVCHDLINYKSYYAILSCSNKQITSFGHELISVLISFSVVKNLKSRQLLGMSWIWLTRLKWVKTKLSKRWHLKLITLRSSSVTSVRLSSSQLPISSELILEPHSVRNSSRPINLKKGSRKKWAPCWMACECSQGLNYLLWLNNNVTWSKQNFRMAPPALERFSLSVTWILKFLSSGQVWDTELSFSSVPKKCVKRRSGILPSLGW